MKTYLPKLIFLFLCLVQGTLQGQTFFSDGSVYYYFTYNSGNWPIRPTGHRDTVHLDSVAADTEYYTYKSLSMKATGNKVYMRSRFENPDSPFFLAYDFNLVAGDTIKGRPGYLAHELIVVDSVGRIITGKDTLTVQYVRGKPYFSGGFTHFYRFVSGIGSMEAGIDYWEHFVFESHQDLAGVCRNGRGMWWQDWTGFEMNQGVSCERLDSVVAISVVDAPLSVHVYPNPACNKVYIDAEEDVVVTINDLYGKTLVTINSSAEISLPPGIYFVECVSGRLRKVEKFIVY